MADDREASGDVKALEKGKQMFESHRIIACSFHQSGQYTFFSGIVGAAMRHKVVYSLRAQNEICIQYKLRKIMIIFKLAIIVYLLKSKVNVD